MDYVVLARKLRPTRFSELIGQETVARALRNAVASGRVAHAFLFAGSRGVGKTSTARILTKALNCERPAEGEPCNACDNCREIAANTAPDVFEIDAASNRGIDNIRELRENTKFTPVKCAFKTYIIDEVHMLTTESFNALLKTLEEPPPHVKFILATTNPHRIPETILSRCQRFDFNRIPVPAMVDYLAGAIAAEGIELSRNALETIARNASGGMRDALTAVDQVVSFAGPKAADEQVMSILGLMDTQEVFTLLGAVLDKDLPGALAAFGAVNDRGHDLAVLLEALIGEVKDFALYLTLGGRDPIFADRLPETLAFFEARHGKVTLDEVQQLFYLFLEVEGQLKRSDFARACFEMGLVKACRVEPLVGVPELLQQVRTLMDGGTSGAPPPSARPGGASAGPPAGTAGATPPFTAGPRGRERASASAGGGARAHGDRGGDDADEAEPAPFAEPPPPPELPPIEAYEAPQGGGAVSPAPARPPVAPPPESPPGDAPRPRSATAGEPDDRLEHASVEELEALLAEPALCDDERWRAFVEAAAPANRTLAAHLRRTEVGAIEADAVELIAPDATAVLAPADCEALAPLLREHFGGAFRIRMNHDSLGQARPAHTITGRSRLRELLRRARRRVQAEQDERVLRIRRFFPQSRIVDIALDESAPGEPEDPQPEQ